MRSQIEHNQMGRSFGSCGKEEEVNRRLWCGHWRKDVSWKT